MKNFSYLTSYNIYYGTIATGAKYKFTKKLKNEQEAEELARNSAKSYYFKNEGKYGLPSYETILKEVEITGLSFETLYDDHINDMMRWYAIPTEIDSVPSRKLRY